MSPFWDGFLWGATIFGLAFFVVGVVFACWRLSQSEVGMLEVHTPTRTVYVPLIPRNDEERGGMRERVARDFGATE